MFATKIIDSQHADLIHDVQYDYYGRRLATCSSDQNIKVWELQSDQEWHCIARLPGHVGSVWRVSWAHPEFGQVIASCGFDRTIAIWEEITNNQLISGSSNWVRRTQLVDPRTSVTDIEFAPRHLGLQLASCSTDGMIRLYEAQDVMDLSQWTLQYDFPTNINASCLSWSKSQVNPPMLAIGNCNPTAENSPRVLLYSLTEGHRTWDRVESLSAVISGAVQDVAFAPNMGQSYHCLAVAAEKLYIFYITYNTDSINGDITGDISHHTSTQYTIDMTQLESDRVWRVCWNVTGSSLTSSGEDGSIRIWQRNHLQYWQQVACIHPDASMPITSPLQLNATTNDELLINNLIHDHSTAIVSRDSSVTALNHLATANQRTATVAVNNVQFHRKAPIPNRNEHVWH